MRGDLLAARASGALDELRATLAAYEAEDDATAQRVREMTRLTDLRMLDVLTW